MEPKRVGIWLRVSTEEQAQGDSPEHHEKRARLYAEAKGWNVVTVYHLEGVSGKGVMTHPETKRMLKEIKEAHITGIIFSKLARLARNTKELLEFADLFQNSNADLISLGESIDTSTPAGRLFYTVIAATTQFEREEIASRVAASVPIRAKLGKPLGGQATFGYEWDKVNKKFVVNKKEGPIRKLIYEIFLKNKRKRATATELTKLGYRTRNGSKFTGNTIERLLRDPTAKGERRANYTKSTGDKKHWKFKPHEEWVITPCEAVVSGEIWDECNRILDGQYRRRKGRKTAHLFAGLVSCTCGKRMYVFYENLVYVCKPCKNRIPAADLEEIYQEQLKSFLLTDTDIDGYLSKSSSAITEKEALLNKITDDIAKLKKRTKDLVQMRLDNELSKESFMTQHGPLEEQLVQLNEQFPELQAEIDFLKIQQLSSSSVLSEAKDLYERWPLINQEEKRSIVEAITDSITIGNGEISFKLAYVPANFKKAEHSAATSGIHGCH